jgi:hypothetical protein
MPIYGFADCSDLTDEDILHEEFEGSYSDQLPFRMAEEEEQTE